MATTKKTPAVGVPRESTILQQRLQARLDELQLKPAPLATSIGKNASFVRDILRGQTREPGADALGDLARALETTPEYLLGKSDQAYAAMAPEPQRGIVPLMGFIGAGAEISPEFEQVPEDGLEQVDLPLPIPEPMLAFEVRGSSQKPRYDEGDVIVVFRDQRRATESFIGEEVAVQTTAGNRYLKTLARSPRGFNLLSFNAPPITGVGLVWIGEIYATVRASQLRRLTRRA